jgi:hypothetical protein
MEMDTDKFAEFAETLERRCFVGWMPEPGIVCEAVLRAMPEIFRDATEDETQAFTNRLLLALRARIALQNSKWQS